jgi:hypothetical protein
MRTNLLQCHSRQMTWHKEEVLFSESAQPKREDHQYREPKAMKKMILKDRLLSMRTYTSQMIHSAMNTRAWLRIEKLHRDNQTCLDLIMQRLLNSPVHSNKCQPRLVTMGQFELTMMRRTILCLNSIHTHKIQVMYLDLLNQCLLIASSNSRNLIHLHLCIPSNLLVVTRNKSHAHTTMTDCLALKKTKI